jgi:hypothetical protein
MVQLFFLKWKLCIGKRHHTAALNLSQNINLQADKRNHAILRVILTCNVNIRRHLERINPVQGKLINIVVG